MKLQPAVKTTVDNQSRKRLLFVSCFTNCRFYTKASILCLPRLRLSGETLK